jgi:NADP-dependent 3-hydroxy acid dehydrogenase YdfG
MHAYGNTTTTDAVLAAVDLTRRRLVITGAASGLGRESARMLVAPGA